MDNPEYKPPKGTYAYAFQEFHNAWNKLLESMGIIRAIDWLESVLKTKKPLWGFLLIWAYLITCMILIIISILKTHI